MGAIQRKTGSGPWTATLAGLACVVATTAWATSAWAAATVAPAPVLPVHDVTQTLHGVLVHDPYRDLEDVKQPAVQAAAFNTANDIPLTTTSLNATGTTLTLTLPTGFEFRNPVEAGTKAEVNAETTYLRFADSGSLNYRVTPTLTGSTLTVEIGRPSDSNRSASSRSSE